MNIVIIGAGEVGRDIAKTLSGEGNNIYIVEKNSANAQNIKDDLDVQVIQGNGARPNVLAQAGIHAGGDVDIMIACTNKDEVNMLSCLIAHTAGVERIISRAKNLEFADSPDWAHKFGIDLMISPERSIAREVVNLLAVSSATHTAELLNGKAAIYTFKIAYNSPLINLALKDIRPHYKNSIANFVYVEHSDGTGAVPNGLTVLKKDDTCYVVTYKQNVWALEELFNPEKVTKQLEKIFIVGGGKLGTQIAQRLRRDFGNVQLRLIEKDKEKSERLAEELGEALVIWGDGAEKGLLNDEGIANADGYVSATDSDELNLIYAALAKKLGVKKSIAVVKQKRYQVLAESLDIAIVNPNEALAALILRMVHYPGHTRALSIIEKINAEMLELVMPENNKLTGRPLMSLNLPRGVIIALMERGEKILVPDGSTQLLPGDHVILFASTDLMRQTAELFDITVQK